MQALRRRLSILVLAALLAPLAQAEERFHITHSESLQDLTLGYDEHINSPGDSTPVVGEMARSMQFHAFSEQFEFRLHSNRALLSAAQRTSLGSNIGVYRGEIVGKSGSWVRVVVVDGAPRGMFWDGTTMYAIDVVDSGNSPSVYRLKDLQIAPGALACSHVGSAKNAATLLQAVVGEASAALASGPGATSQIDLAIISDSVFTNARGASAEADVIARMNVVDGLFSDQLGVQLNLNRVDIFDDTDDPFSDQLDAGDLLDEVANYRNSTPAQNANGLTHLFTGRNLDETTVGIAFGSAVCSRRFGAALTQGTFGLTTDSLIAAHEIGHNFGAPHDGTAGACESESQDFIMAPRINGSDQFSACSIVEMRAEIATANCLSPLPSTDVAVVSSTQVSNDLLGNSATIIFTVDSVGTDVADDVSIDVTLPSSVTLNGVSAGSGTCNSGAGNANCALGSIAAGSGVDVSLDITNTATGSANFSATIASAVDVNSNNNQSSVQYTIDPAIDLIAAAVTGQVALNDAATIRPSVDNQSSIVANNVTLTITPDADLQIDSVSWPAGSCNIANNVATCEAATLAAQSSTMVDLQVTGTSEGTLPYTLAVTANDVDRNTVNNSASANVSVGPEVTAADDSGGGAMGWLMLLWMGMARLILRKR